MYAERKRYHNTILNRENDKIITILTWLVLFISLTLFTIVVTMIGWYILNILIIYSEYIYKILQIIYHTLI